MMLAENTLSFIETSALDASNVETAFQKILTEIYRLVSQKAMEQNEEQAAKPGQGQVILVAPTASGTDAKQSKCC